MAEYIEWDYKDEPPITRIEKASIKASNTNVYDWYTGSPVGAIVVGAKSAKEAVETIIDQFYFEGNLGKNWSLEEHIDNSDIIFHLVHNSKEFKNQPKGELDVDKIIKFLRKDISRNIREGCFILEEMWNIDIVSYLENFHRKAFRGSFFPIMMVSRTWRANALTL